MKIGFITTVLNEEKSIERLFDSLLNQCNSLNSIIIVDAGSTDRTLDIIKNFKKKFKQKNKKLLFKLILKKGNRSIGRNLAIENSDTDIIIASDAGCILHKDWVSKLVGGFGKNIDVVAGFYKPLTNNTFEKCLASYTCVMKDKITTDFLPSSRSIGFKKNAWKKVGGYPEDMDTCEDLVFAKKLKKEGFKFKVEKNAIVYWLQRKNLVEAFKQFFLYAKGDGYALYVRPQTPLLFLRYMIALVLITLGFYNLLFLFFILYLAWAILKNYKYVRELLGIIYLPALQLVSDIAVITGMAMGIIIRFSKIFS